MHTPVFIFLAFIDRIFIFEHIHIDQLVYIAKKYFDTLSLIVSMQGTSCPEIHADSCTTSPSESLKTEQSDSRRQHGGIKVKP